MRHLVKDLGPTRIAVLPVRRLRLRRPDRHRAWPSRSMAWSPWRAAVRARHARCGRRPDQDQGLARGGRGDDRHLRPMRPLHPLAQGSGCPSSTPCRLWAREELARRLGPGPGPLVIMSQVVPPTEGEGARKFSGGGRKSTWSCWAATSTTNRTPWGWIYLSWAQEI